VQSQLRKKEARVERRLGEVMAQGTGGMGMPKGKSPQREPEAAGNEGPVKQERGVGEKVAPSGKASEAAGDSEAVLLPLDSWMESPENVLLRQRGCAEPGFPRTPSSFLSFLGKMEEIKDSIDPERPGNNYLPIPERGEIICLRK